jgi:molybdate transport system ATP-binding protein
MLLFARAIVKNPQLLILDEPFHGMDVVNKKRCLQMISTFATQPDKSLIFVTHYKEEIPDSVNNIFELAAH